MQALAEPRRLPAAATAAQAAPSSAALAASPAAEPAAQVLTFLLGGRTFAIGIASITEIIKYGQVTPVPRTPAHIRGVINLRGAVLPVLDLNVYVGQAAAQPDGQTCIVVIEAPAAQGTQAIGLMVDSVSAVLALDAGQIEPVPTFGVGLPPQLLRGMARVQDRFIVLLDAQQAFSAAALTQRGWTPTEPSSRRVPG